MYGGAFVDPLTRQGDESAVLYTLPNGLPAYFLADANGRRRDQSSVLIDTSQDDFVPRTAPSCVRCHSSNGVIQLVDELLLGAYDGDLRVEDAAAELFVSPTELRDRRRDLPGPLRVLTSLGSLDRESFSAAYGEALCALSSGWRNVPVDCP